jgi:hypothetical protein
VRFGISTPHASLADKGVIRLRMEAGRFWHELPEEIREAYQRQSAPLPSEIPATPVPPPAPASGAEARVPPAAPASVTEAPPQASAKQPDATTASVTPPAAPPAELPIEGRLMQAMQKLATGEKVTPAHVRQAQQLVPDSEMALGCMDQMYENQVRYLQRNRLLPKTFQRVDQLLAQVCRDCADIYPLSPFRVKWDQRQAARKPKA